MARQTISRSQAFAIMKILEAHCAKGDEEGFAKYEAGWSDERVHVETVNPEPDRPITIDAVYRLRAEMFGKVRVPKPPSKSDEEIAALKNEIFALKKIIVGVQEEQRSLTDWVKRLADYIQRNVKAYTPPPGKAVATPPDHKVHHQ